MDDIHVNNWAMLFQQDVILYKENGIVEKERKNRKKKSDTLLTTFEKYNLQGHRSNALYILQHRTQITDPGSVAYIDSNVSL